MNSLGTVVLSTVLLLIAILLAILINRQIRNRLRRAQEMQGKDEGFERGFRHAIETAAKVISKSETIVPNAGGYAKVDLLVEMRLPGKAPYQISVCWLVEVNSLDQVLPGRNVSVKVDPKKPSLLLPLVPWAKPWIFG